MKDYSDYRPSTYDKIYWSNKKVFNQELKCKGDDVLLNGLEICALIKQHSNPFNEKKEERKFLCSLDVNIFKGSLINYENSNWLVTSQIDSNKVHKFCKILECNNVLKFYDKTSVLNSIVSVPCIKNKKNTMSLGEEKFLTTIEGKIEVQVPINKNTLTIYEGQRFIIDRTVYRVIGIYDDTNIGTEEYTGILKINMEKVQKDDKDNFETGIAWNKDDVLNSYKILVINGQDISFSVSQSLQLDINVLNNDEIITPIPELIYTSSNEEICVVNNSGIITGISDGECIVSVTLESEPSIITNINIKVSSAETHNYSVNITGSEKIIKKRQSTYSCVFYDNAEIIVRESVFYLTENDGITPLNENIAKIISQDNVDNSCIVQTYNFSGIHYCKLFVKSNDDSIVSSGFDIKIMSLI